MRIRLNDKAAMSTRRKTKNGFLEGEALIARTGVQDYFPSELVAGGVDVPPHFLGLPKITLMRDEADVFRPETMAAMAHLPLTIGHPDDDVDADNVDSLQVGFTKGPAVRDGDYIKTPVVFQQKRAIKMIEEGMDELSAGYDVDIVFLKSVQDAQAKGYHGKMTNIIPNHVALVDQARGGSNVRLKDEGVKKMTVSRVIDGVTFEFDAQSAQVVDGIMKKSEELKAQIAKLGDEKSALEGKLDITKKDLEKEKASKVSDADIAKMVGEKSDLIAIAKTYIKDGDFSSKSNLDIQKEVILSVHDSVDFEGKDSTYINAMYDTVRLSAKDEAAKEEGEDGDGSTQKLSDGIKKDDKKQDPRAAMIARRNKKK